MPTITPADIRARFIAFSGLENAVIQSFLDMVSNLHVTPDIWQDPALFKEGTLLATAHFLMLEVIQQAIVTAMTTGVSKGQQQNLNQLSGKEHWELTVYGLQFRDLMKSLPTVGGIPFGA
ncbi:MAG TPA: DUF4054 domain-containing protein [Trichocoleus sp.]